jgi:AraC-like DNA-binding protein
MKASFVKVLFDSNNLFQCEYVDLAYFNHPWHFHPEYELTLILESSGIRYVGNHVTRFKEGDLVFIGSNLPHLWHNDKQDLSKSNTRSRAIVIQFSKNFINHLFQNSTEINTLKTLFNNSKKGIFFSEEISSVITPYLLKIYKEKGLKKWELAFKVLDLLANTNDYKLLCSSDYHPKLVLKDNDIMNKIFIHIRNNVENKIELETIAKIACLSKPSFCRYFKKKTSKTFVTFLNEYRIGFAKKMMIEKPHLSIGNIALKSGFPNVQHFNTKFKALNNITPSQFRKKIKI